MLQYVLIFMLLLRFHDCFRSKQIVGPLGKIDLTIVDSCPYSNDLHTTVDVHLKKGNGSQWVEAKFELPFDIDDSIMFKISFDKWTGSEWKEGYQKGEGPFCEYQIKYFQQLYGKLAAAFRPKFPRNCPIPKGNYNAEKITLEPEDIDFPSVLYGKFRIIFMGYKGNSTIWCVESHLTSTAK